MPYVLDASFALSWCFADEHDAASSAAWEALRDDHALVPSLWRLEVTNALRVGERRRRIAEDASVRFLRGLEAVEIRIAAPPSTDDALRLLDAAREFDLTIYDASYLLLARDWKLPLASKDAKLLAASQKAGVALAFQPAP